MTARQECDHLLATAAAEGTATQRGVTLTRRPDGWRISTPDGVRWHAEDDDHVASTLRRFLRRAPVMP